MVMSNPTPLGAFWSRLPVQSINWDLGAASVSSRTEGGELITAERGVRLWRASVTLHSMLHRDAEAILARLSALVGADRSFLACPRPVESPAIDPDGVIIGGYSPTIAQIAADRIQISLANMPPHYQLHGGEFLALTYGADPVRYGLHQIVADDPIADATTQVTPLFEVRPAIRPGAVVGAAVTLYRPPMRAQLVRDSISYGSSGRLRRAGISFDIIQTLRG